MNTRRVPRVLLAGLFVLAAVATQPWTSSAQIGPDVIEEAIARTVHLTTLIRVQGQEGKLKGHFGCSGSFVTPTGVILTADHCVRATENEPDVGIHKGDLYTPEGLVAISVHVPGKIRPVLTMMARHVADDPAFDLALLKVTGLIGRGGQEGLPSDFKVPYLPIGDSERLRHGEAIAVIGFPGVGGDTVTAGQGFVTGFIGDDQNRRLWIKLEAASGPGGSGGPVINARGEQIGVLSGARVDPSQAVRSIRAMPTNRIPAPWSQHLAGNVNAGRAPSPSAPTPSGPGVPSAVVEGHVVDAATGSGIPGATINILKPGASIRAPARTDVLASAVTDATGLFRTKPPVPRGVTYPIVIHAGGYLPATGNLELGPIGPEIASVHAIQMERLR